MNDFEDDFDQKREQAPSPFVDASNVNRQVPDSGEGSGKPLKDIFWQEGDPEPEELNRAEQESEANSQIPEAPIDVPASRPRKPMPTREAPLLRSTGPGSLDFQPPSERRVKEADDRRAYTGAWRDKTGDDYHDMQEDVDAGLPEMPKKGLGARFAGGVKNFFSAIGRGIAAPFKGIGRLLTRGKRRRAKEAADAKAEQDRIQAEAAAVAKQKQDGINALASEPLEFQAQGVSASREDIEAPMYRKEKLDPFYDSAQAQADQYLNSRPRHIRDPREQWRNPDATFDPSTAPRMPEKPKEFYKLPAGMKSTDLKGQEKLKWLMNSEETYNQSMEEWKPKVDEWRADRDRAKADVEERNRREGISEEKPGLADLYASQEKGFGAVGYGSADVDLGWSKEGSFELGRQSAMEKEALRRAEKQLKPGLSPKVGDDDMALHDKRTEVEHQRRLLAKSNTPAAAAALGGMADSIDTATDTYLAGKEAERRQAEDERKALLQQESARMQSEHDAKVAAEQAALTEERHARYMEQIRNPESREKYQPIDRSGRREADLARYLAEDRADVVEQHPMGGGLFDHITSQEDPYAGMSVRDRMLAKKKARGETPLEFDSGVEPLNREQFDAHMSRVRQHELDSQRQAEHVAGFQKGLSEGAFDDQQALRDGESTLNPMMDFIKSDDASIEADKKAEQQRKLNRITQNDSLGSRLTSTTGKIEAKYDNWDDQHAKMLGNYQRGYRADVAEVKRDMKHGLADIDELEEEQDIETFEKAQLGRIDVGEGVSGPTEQDYEAPWVDMQSKVETERDRVKEKPLLKRVAHNKRLAGLTAGNAGKSEIRAAREELGTDYANLPNDKIRSALNLYNSERIPAMKKGVLHHGSSKSKSGLPTTLPGRVEGDAVDRLPIFLREQGLLAGGEQVSDVTRSALTQKRGDFLRGQLKDSLDEYRPKPVDPEAERELQHQQDLKLFEKHWAKRDKQIAAQEKAEAKARAKQEKKDAKTAESERKQREKWANDPKRLKALAEAEEERKKGPSLPDDGRDVGQVLGEMPVLFEGYLGAGNLPSGENAGAKAEQSAAALSGMKPLVRQELTQPEYEQVQVKGANGWDVTTVKQKKPAEAKIVAEKPKLPISEEEGKRYQEQYEQFQAPAKAAAAKFAKSKKLKDVPSARDFLRSDNDPARSSLFNDYATARQAHMNGYDQHITRSALSSLPENDPHRGLASEVIPGKKSDKIKHTYKWNPGTDDIQKALSSDFDDFAQHRKYTDIMNSRPELKPMILNDEKKSAAQVPPVSAPVSAPSQMQPPVAPGSDGVIRMNVASSQRSQGTMNLVAQPPVALPQPSAESMRIAQASKDFHIQQQAYNDSTSRKVLNAVTFGQTNKAFSGVNQQLIQQSVEDSARELDANEARRQARAREEKKKKGFFKNLF